MINQNINHEYHYKSAKCRHDKNDKEPFNKNKEPFNIKKEPFNLFKTKSIYRFISDKLFKRYINKNK